MTEQHVVRVCTDGACYLRDAYAFADHVRDVFEPRDDVEVRECHCLGRCDRPPAIAFDDVPIEVAEVEELAEDPDAVPEGGGPVAEGRPGRLQGAEGRVSLTGDIERPGAYAVPPGTSYRTLVEAFGGGVRGGRGLHAVAAGGVASPILVGDALDAGVDTDVVIALSDEADLLAFATNLVRFLLGDTDEAVLRLEKILRDEGEEGELDRLRAIARTLEGTARAGALTPVLSLA